MNDAETNRVTVSPMSKMGRPKKADRSTVATHTLTIRMTADERDALEQVVRMRERQMQKLVPNHSLSVASFVRGLIQASVDEASQTVTPPSPAQDTITTVEVDDAKPRKKAPKVDISTPAPTSFEQIEAAIREHEDKRLGMTWVHDLVRAVGTDDVEDVLLDGARAGRWELRPESGLGRLTKEEKALCPRNSDGALLSLVRLPSPDPAPSTDADALLDRLQAAYDAGHTLAAIAAAAGLNKNTLAAFRSNGKLGAAKRQQLSDALAGLGY